MPTRSRSTVSRLAASIVVAVLAALAGMAPACLAADHSLTLTTKDAPGFSASGSGRAAARSALARKPTGGLRRAPAKGSAFRADGGRRLATGVFTFGSKAKARAALRRARRGHKRLWGVGDEAWRRSTTKRKKTIAVVLLREGSALGAVKVTVNGRRAKAAQGAAESFARALAGRMQRVLGLTAYQRTLDEIGPDGSVSAATALKAFAIAYGPLPGVKRPGGRKLGVPESATLAMQLVARVWDQLSPEQQAAVDRALGAPHDASSARVARASEQVLTPNAGYQAIADKFVALHASKLPGVTPPQVKVFTASEDITSQYGDTLADALPVNAAGEWGVGPVSYCRVRVPPKGQATAGGPLFQLILAHETFHCFQFQIEPAWPRLAAWIIEGMADWAATSAFATSAAVGAGPYLGYLQTTNAPTFGRTYDATGFWHWTDELLGVGSLWAKIPAILRSPDNESAFVAAGGNTQAFQESWASAAFRLSSAGALWKQTRPYAIPIGQVGPAVEVVTSSTSLGAGPATMTDAVVVRDPERPIVNLLTLAGKLRAGVEGRDFGVRPSAYYCWGKCKCPRKSTGKLPPHEKLAGNTVVAGLTGGLQGAAARVTYHDLDEFCKKKPDPSGPAESNGDPHLTTLDGLHFDFQAAGEFLLARSRGSDLEIQARQEPYGESKGVTVNTQIALRLGGRRVTLAPGPSDQGYAPVVRIDGAVEGLAAGTSVTVGDGTLTRQANEGGWVTATWADGSTVVVRPVGTYGVAMVVQLAEGRASTMSGVLGDFDSDPADDLADRRGKRIKYTVKASEGWLGAQRFTVAQEYESKFFDDLYDDFGDAWRVSQSESLFDYGPGQSTKTFTNKKLPAKPVGPDELRRARREEAERVCREAGVTQPGPLADCIIDVGATGDPAFAVDALYSQQAASVVWSQLRGGRSIAGDIRLARAADGLLHVAFTEGAGGPERQMVNVPIDPVGREGAQETIRAADGSAGLFTATDGGVRAVTAEIPSEDPAGVYQYARDPAGAWSPQGLVTSFETAYASRPSALALPGGGLLTASPMAGVARLFVGAPANGEGTPFPAPEGCSATSPSLARDASNGAIWAAWSQSGCPQIGMFAAQVDPGTGAFGPPVQAPGSAWDGPSGPSSPSIELGENAALTGRPGQAGVYLAYAAGVRGDVALWPVGAPDALTLPRRSSEARHVRLAAEPDSGRLWIAWDESGVISVQRTSAQATVDTPPRPVLRPPNDSGDPLRPGDLQIDARGGKLDLVYALQGGDTPGALFWARVAP
ncbi:MAG TPA: VWD domain-containing protein [Solirubrobacteraceae bacterium]